MEQVREKQTALAARYERCVLCGGVTAMQRDTPVSERRDYIEGCGQLCEPCFRRLSRKTTEAGGAGQTGMDKSEISSGWATPLK